MISREQAFRLMCKLADALQDAEDQGNDKMIGVVPDEMLSEVMCFARQLHVEPEDKD